MPPMTQAQGRANWIRRPSLSQPWLRSTLRTLAMLVSLVARLFPPRHPNPTAECDGRPAQTPEANDVLDQFREAATIITTTRKQQRNSNRKAAARGDVMVYRTPCVPAWDEARKWPRFWQILESAPKWDLARPVPHPKLDLPP